MRRPETITDYVERTLASFDSSPFTPVDSLVLSWASYFRVVPDVPAAATPSGARIRNLLLAEFFPTFFSTQWDPPHSKALLLAMGASPRYRDVVQFDSVDEVDPAAQMQFAAASYRLTDDLVYVAFRGTDRTLVGWKEDFNMTVRCPVPAQRAAADYLARIAEETCAKLLVGGHSKGGNLAIWAAAANAKRLGDRLVRVYSHDGPGFLPEILERPEFALVRPKVAKTVPHSSVVGMLLDQQGAYDVVKSTRVGLWQHDPFSWVVEGDGFALVDRIAPEARRLDETLTAWFEAHTEEEREAFIDAVYDLVTVPGVETVSDLLDSWQTSLPRIRSRAAAMDPQTRAFVRDSFALLARIGLGLERGR